MSLRWTATGMLEPQTAAQRVSGDGDLAKLTVAVEHDAPPGATPTWFHTSAVPEVNPQSMP